jgi:hypothetical protein
VTRVRAWFLCCASALWTCLLLAVISDTGVDFISCLVAVVGTLLLSAGCLIAASGAHKLGASHTLIWLAPALLTLAAVALFLTSQSPLNPAFRIRFALSKEALRRAADNPPPIEGRWAGLFHVRHIDRNEGRTVWFTTSCGVVDQCGLALLPFGPPAGVYKTQYKALGDHWYVFYEAF